MKHYIQYGMYFMSILDESDIDVILRVPCNNWYLTRVGISHLFHLHYWYHSNHLFEDYNWKVYVGSKLKVSSGYMCFFPVWFKSNFTAL